MAEKTKSMEDIEKDIEFVTEMQEPYSEDLAKAVLHFLRARGYEIDERAVKKGVEIITEIDSRGINAKDTKAEAVYCVLRCDKENENDNAFWNCASSCYEGDR
ncbi:MAG: hypothetical protein ACP5NE_01080 [Candidatus Micrarchaeia archaeon]